MSETNVPFVCFALPGEARPFRAVAQKVARHSPPVRVIVTGMGVRNTERVLTAALGEATPLFVLTCGLAGGLDPALARNTVVFETADEALAARLNSAGLRAARFHCAPRIIVTAAEKAAVRRNTRADAVEMESGKVHEICRKRGLPCATVRVISDTAKEDLPMDFNKLATPELEMDFGKLAWALIKSPGRIPALCRLQRQVTEAAQALAEALFVFFDGER